MSLFGGSRAQSLAADEFAPNGSQSSTAPSSKEPSPVDKASAAADTTSGQSLFVEKHPYDYKKLEEPRDESNDVDGEDAESLAAIESTDKSDASRRLTRAENHRFRGYYQDELNLVDAFEAAAESDLAYNLLGVTLEKRHHLSPNPDKPFPPWVSKARWYGEDANDTEFPGLPGISKDWTAWPLRPGQLPDRNEWLSAGQDNLDGRARKRRRLEESRNELEETLSTFAMDHASKQFAAKETTLSTGAGARSRDAMASEEVDLDTLAQADDENKTAKILSPLSSATTTDLARVLSAISTSRVAQVISGRPQARNELEKAAKRWKRRRRYSSEGETDDDELEGFVNDGGRAAGSAKLGLRDWSDVLSVAATVGWNSNALQRTMDRCSKLLREGASFLNASPQPQPISTTSRADAAAAEVSVSTNKKPPISLKDWDTWSTFICPHEVCPSALNVASNPCSSRKNLRNHLRSVHKWDPKEFFEFRKDLVYNNMVDDVRVDGFLEIVHAGEVHPNGRQAEW